MKNRALAATGWVLVGMALMGAATWVLMPRLIVNDYQKATAAYRSLESVAAR